MGSDGKRQSIAEHAEITQMLELSDKDFKAAIIKMLQDGRINTPEVNEKIESISKTIEDTQKNKGIILKLKNKIYKNLKTHWWYL